MEAEEIPAEVVTAENIPDSDPFADLIGVPDAVYLTCPVASKNLNLANVPGTIVAADAAIDVQFPTCRVTTSRDNLKIIANG